MINERLRELETKLCNALELDTAGAAKVHRHTMLVAREAHVELLTKWGWGDFGIVCTPEEYRKQMAADAFPLPPKRVLREEPDPNAGEVLWRYGDDGLAYKPLRDSAAYPSKWTSLTGGIDSGRVFAPYPARIRLWADLLANPYREVPDNGDE